MVTKKLESSLTKLQNWRELYQTAIFECDRYKLPLRIHEAEKALNLRSRELFATSGNNREERDAIDHALHRLRALSYCARLNPSMSAIA
jgi:hypothetical protein